MEIAPGIHLIPGVVGGRPLQLYLLHGDERSVLLDTGCAGDPEALIFPYLANLGLTPRDIDMVINTHSDLDHVGGNAAIKRANPRVLITCGELDRALIADPAVMWERRYTAYAAQHGIAYDEASRAWIMSMLGQAQPVDFTWSGGQTLRLGRDWTVEIHHTPGHSPGHLSLYDRERRIVLTGDAAHGAVYLTTDGQPALSPTYTDVDAYLGTLRYLHGLGAEVLCGCHWPVKHGQELTAFLDESRQFVHLVDEVLLRELAQRPGGATLRELMMAAGPWLGDWPRTADSELVYALAGHLNRLVAQGRAECDDGEHPVRYRGGSER